MKKIILACLLALLFWTITNLAQAQLNEGQFILSADKGRITLQAENASVKEILAALEEKTGLKVVVYEGVPDRKVTLNAEATPIYAIGTLLQQLSLRNTAIVYEEKLRSMALYVLPEGMDPSTVLQGKTIIRPATFPDPSKANEIKGKPIITTLQGKNNVPIRYVDGEILLKFHRGVTKEEIDALISKYRLEKDRTNGLSPLGYVKVRIGDGRDVIEVIKEIRKERILKVPEPNYVASTLTVTDPLYKQQWYIPGTNFEEAWPMLKSKATVPVAVVDTGVHADHPDLKGRILKGYDFVNGKDDAGDDHGHGTFVAGIIAASANDIGIRGLYDQARILPVKAIDNQGLGTYEDVAKGIVYAADAGARIINLSIGGYAYSYLLQDAVDYALEKGCILVAAGGNDGIEQQIYPAAYPDVIGVSALSYDGQIWSSSNSGKHIDVAAPGANIISTGLGEGYVYATGTSASASMVSALVAMLVSERPDLSSSIIERLIMQSTKDLGEKGRDKIYGSGEVDALAALEQKVKPFHDVAVGKIYPDRTKNTDRKGFDIEIVINNLGTFPTELVSATVKMNDSIFQQNVRLHRKSLLRIPYMPSSTSDSIDLRVEVEVAGDENKENNVRHARLISSYDSEQNLWILYSQSAHMWIAKQALYEWPGTSTGNQIAFNEINYYLSNIRTGAFNEDESSPNPFGDWMPYLRHFWDHRNYANPTPLQGWYADDTAVNRAYKYWTGGYGWNSSSDNWLGTYDTAWDNDYGVQGKGAVQLYKDGQKTDAYTYLGHIAHLLADMAVPAHVLGDPHGCYYGVCYGGDDQYEVYMSDSNNYMAWGDNGGAAPVTGFSVPSVSSIRDVFNRMAEIGDNFESDNYHSTNPNDGATYGHTNGHADNWWSGDVSNAECRVHQDTLEREAIVHVAGLYKMFWENTHPDLTASAFVGSPYTSGQTGIQIPVTVTRSGSNLTQGTHVHAKLYWSTNNTWDSSDTILWSSNDSKPDFPNSTLNSNGNRTVNATISIPVVNSGTYYIIAYADPPTSSYPSGYHDEINEGNNITVYAITVTPQSGTLSVTTTPVSGGITVDGTFKANGSWSGSVATGSHTISFGSVSGYTTPANQTVTVNNGQTTTVTGTYTQQSGTLSVTTTPVSGGITVDGAFKANGSWSGSVATGSHTVSFGAVSGYNTPATQTVTVNAGQTTNVTGTYTQQTGTLSVTTTPVSGGITVDGAFKANGSWSGSVATGSHTVSFGAVSGYNTPATQTVTVNNGQTTNVTGTYTTQSTPTITVTNPASGSTLIKGTNYTITWTSSNVTGNVQIDLYKGSANYQQLAASDPNDGSYPFTPLSSFPDGSDYRICVSAMSGSVSHCSGNFTIQPQATPTLTITYPNGGESLTKGTNYTITWSSSNVTGNVQIDLYKGSSNYQQLAASDPNDGSYPFTPLNSFPDGSDYRICISAMSGTVSDCSNSYFTIQSMQEGVLTLATGLSNPTDIAVDDTSVYWAEYGSGTVKKVSKDGGSVTTLASGLYSATSLAVDSSYVYFAEDVGINAANIKKVSKSGGSSTTLASGQPSAWKVTVDGANVYWTDGYGGTIRKVPINGGSVSILATGSTSPSGIVVDSTNVYWSEFTNPGAVRKVPIQGGTVTTLANNSNTPGISVNGNNLYWTENVWSNNGKLSQVSVNGGSITNLATGLNSPWDVAADGTNAYFVENSSGGTVKQVPSGGGGIITLASGLAEPVAVAIDGSNVYWIERNGGGNGTGSVKKVQKVSNPVNGTCGTSNGQTFTTAPTTNLCSTGSSTPVSGSGPWNWSCTGSNGGTTANCSANLQGQSNCSDIYPNPIISLSKIEDYSVGSNQYTRYSLNVNNYTVFPDALFAAAPDLPPCGLNNNSSRTWVEIYNGEDNSYIYGFCALSSSVDMNGIWFSTAKGSPPPKSVYIKLNDRLCNISYSSNSLNISLYNVTPSAGSNGTISPTTVQTVNSGATATFTITPASGYEIVTPIGGTCGGTLSGNTYTTNPITTSCTVSATFTLNPVSGVCGSSNGGIFTLAPTTNLCSFGTSTSVSGNGPWTWSCIGSNGGTTASCSANIRTTAIKGDINGNGTVNLADAILAIQIISGIPPAVSVKKDADVNGDNKIGIEEGIYILQFIAGMRHSVTGLVADFKFDGTPYDSAGISGPILLNNTTFIDDHLYLNGIYEYNGSNNGYRAIAPISNFQYETFTVSIEFYSLGWNFPGYARNILTGGTSYRWFSLNWSNGKLLLSLNNGDFYHLFDNTNLSENGWHNITCSFDLNNKKVITSLDGVILDQINLDNNFTLEILGSNTWIEADKVFTFTNYSNGSVFYGYVDNLKVYNRALSESEILGLY